MLLAIAPLLLTVAGRLDAGDSGERRVQEVDLLRRVERLAREKADRSPATVTKSEDRPSFEFLP